MPKVSERRFCPRDGGHWVDNDTGFWGGFYCPEHDSRIKWKIESLAFWVIMIIVLVFVAGGVWGYCLATDAERAAQICETVGC